MAICLGITYNSVDNDCFIEYISGDVHGDSFDNLYNYQDIIDTAVDGSWAKQPSRQGNQFDFPFSITINNSDTYFGDSNKQIQYSDQGTKNVFDGINYANIDLQDINFKSLVGSLFDIRYFTSNSQILKCTFDGFGRIYTGNQIFEDNYIYTGGFAWQAKSTFVKNIYCYDPLYPQSNFQSTENIVVYNYIIHYGVSLDIKNLRVKTTGTNFYWYPGLIETDSVSNFTDSTVDIDNYGIVSYGKTGSMTINLRSTFKVNIAGGDGGLATLYDQFDNQIAQQILSGEWALADKVLYAQRYIETDGSLVENTKTVYEPLKLVVEKSGYQTLEIPNIYCTIDGIGTLSPTVVEGKMVLVEVTGENLQHFITEDKLTHEITD